MRATDVMGLLRLTPSAVTRRERVLAHAQVVADLHAEALRFWPRSVADYVEGGAGRELTVARNTQAFERARLDASVLRDVGAVDTSATILGRPATLPLVLSPTGYTRMMHPRGELEVTAAAGAQGVPYVLSTMATTSIEDVARESEATDRWFQLYVWRDRAIAEDLMARAWASGYRAIVVTVDTPSTGHRVRDHRSGFTIPPAITPTTAVDMARHPRWSLGLLRGEVPTFANIRAERAPEETPMGVLAFSMKQFDPTVTFADLPAITASWPGRVLVKGVMTPADARRVVDDGADGVIVSNHGGRQLDGAPASLDVLPAVRAAVGPEVTVHLDSGVRTGTDIAVAIASGADAVGIGRAYLYGVGAAGRAGVEKVVELLRADLALTMKLLGVSSLAELRERGPELVGEAGPTVDPQRREPSRPSRTR